MENGVRLACFATFALLCGMAHAEEALPLDVHGFGTFYGTRVSDAQHSFRRADQSVRPFGEWSFDVDSKLGVQVDVAARDPLSGTVQIVYRRVDSAHFEPTVEWAFVKYDIDPVWRVRLGRLLTPLTLDSENMNVAYSLVSARGPDVALVYPLTQHDGFDLSYQTPLAQGTLSSTLFGGSAHIDRVDAQNRPLANRLHWMVGGKFLWESEHWTLNLSHIQGMMDYSGPAAEATIRPFIAPLQVLTQCAVCQTEVARFKNSFDGFVFHQTSIGVRANFEPWLLSAEFTARTSASVLNDFASLSLEAAYRVGDWQPYLGYNNDRTASVNAPVFPTLANPAANALMSTLNRAYQQNYVDRGSVSLGLRWEARRSLALRGELMRVHMRSPVAQAVVFPTNAPGQPRAQDFNLYTLGLNFVF